MLPSPFMKLNIWLRAATEEQVEAALERERHSPAPRRAYLKRLHERFGTLRAKRERAALLGETDETTDMH